MSPNKPKEFHQSAKNSATSTQDQIQKPGLDVNKLKESPNASMNKRLSDDPQSTSNQVNLSSQKNED